MKKFTKIFEELERESISGGWQSVVAQEDPYHSISDSDMISFIEKNSEMDWNDICDYVRDNNITGEDGSISWHRREGDSNSTNPAEMWIGRFFEAHPWITQMYIIFN